MTLPGLCSGPLRLELRDAAGAPVTATASVKVFLMTDGKRELYSTSTCAAAGGGAAVALSEVTIAAGSNAAAFYVYGERSGVAPVVATPGDSNLAGDTQNHTVVTGPAHAVRVESPTSQTTLDVGECQGPFGLSLRDFWGNLITPSVSTGLSVSATLSAVFPDAACTASASTVTLTSAAAVGQVWLRANQGGAETLRAEVASESSVNGSLSLTVNAPNLVLELRATQTERRRCLPVDVTLQNRLGRGLTSTTDVAFSVTGTGLTAYDSDCCRNAITSGTLAAAQTTTRLWVSAEAAASATVLATPDSNAVNAGSAAIQIVEPQSEPLWWNTAFCRRVPVSLSSTTVPADYSLSLRVDHAGAVTGGRSLASGEDVRVVAHQSNGSPTELDRVLDMDSAWNQSNTQFWFRHVTPQQNGTTVAYWIYYDAAPTVARAPQNPDNVFLFHDDFEDGGLDAWDVSFGSTSSSGSEVDHFQSQPSCGTGGSRCLRLVPAFYVNPPLFIQARHPDVRNVIVEAHWRTTDPQVAAGLFLRGSIVAPGGNGQPTDELEAWSTEANASDLNLWRINAGGGDAQLGSTRTGVIPNGAYFRMTVTAHDRRYSARLNGVEMPVATDNARPTATGFTGVEAYRVTSTGAGARRVEVDDYVVRHLVLPEPTLTLGIAQKR